MDAAKILLSSQPPTNESNSLSLSQAVVFLIGFMAGQLFAVSIAYLLKPHICSSNDTIEIDLFDCHLSEQSDTSDCNDE